MSLKAAHAIPLLQLLAPGNPKRHVQHRAARCARTSKRHAPHVHTVAQLGQRLTDAFRPMRTPSFLRQRKPQT